MDSMALMKLFTLIRYKKYLIWITAVATTLMVVLHLHIYASVSEKKVVKEFLLRQQRRLNFNEQIRSSNSDPPEANIPIEMCEEIPPNLIGKLKINSSFTPTLDEVKSVSGDVIENGCYKPTHCVAGQKLAIVIPYKDRYQHLLTLLYYLNPILQRQQQHYCIIVAEQYGDGIFNKARIMNSAFAEATKKREKDQLDFDCFIFHDVDMLPEDDRNLYVCSKSPKHLSPAIDKFNYTVGYGTHYGGVTAISKENYLLLNGHSNKFWGWGGEDNDMENRISEKNLTIETVNETVGRYKMIKHEHPWWFDPDTGTGSFITVLKEQKKLSSKKKKQVTDKTGLSDVKYTLVEFRRHDLWIKLSFDIRDYEMEKIKLTMISIDGASIEIVNPSLGTSRDKVSGAALPVVECQPEYFKFPMMTLNLTKDLAKEFTVFTSFNEAVQKCNDMGKGCRAIVEQMKGKFTLRCSPFVQENKLIYKYGLSQQYDVIEDHHTTAVYVKICSKIPDYTQFFTEPLILDGDLQKGVPPRFFLEIYIRVYNEYFSDLSYHYNIVTSHRAVMEQKFANGELNSLWWDSLGYSQSDTFAVKQISDLDEINRLTLKKDVSWRTIRLQMPIKNLARRPGCYYAQAGLVDEESGKSVISFDWWFQIRAKSKEIEDQFIKQSLEYSMKTGEAYNKMVKGKNIAMGKVNKAP